MKKVGFKAEITVFLSLILTVVLWCCFIVIEGSRVTNLNYLAQSMLDAGCFSLFGDYNRVLLEEYDLFLLDAAYNSEQISDKKLKEKLEYYMNYNDAKSLGNNLLEQDIANISIDGLGIVTNDCGRVFRRKAINSIDNSIGRTILEKIQNYLEDDEMEDRLYEEYKNESESLKQNIETNNTNSDTDLKIFDDDRIKEFNKVGSLDLLNLVVSDKEALSTASINKEAMLSSRVNFDLNCKSNDNSIDKALFGEYILKHFDSYLSKALKESKYNGLSYEVEHIITGDISDVECLRSVVKRLLVIREASNFVFLIKNPVLIKEANAMATAIAGFTGNPVAIKGVQALIIVAWSHGESILDIRYLLEGEKVPIVKNEDTWNCNLSMLVELLRGKRIENKNTDGLDYNDYLRLLLFMEDTNEKTINCMNLIENNIRAYDGYGRFCLNNCVENIDVSVEFKSKSIFVQNYFDYSFRKSKHASYSEYGDE